MEYITRDEAVKLSSEKLVTDTENMHCEFDRYKNHGETCIYTAVTHFYDADGFILCARVHYEIDRQLHDKTEDISDLNWVIAGYSVS